MGDGKIYVDVLLPLKLRGFLSYCVEACDAPGVEVGTWVKVNVRGRISTGIVAAIQKKIPENLNKSRIKPVEQVLDCPRVGPEEIKFWEAVAQYYLCTPGEVFKAVHNGASIQYRFRPVRKVKKAPESVAVSGSGTGNTLSEVQQEALSRIEKAFSEKKTVLLEGVTGSGKTEIYIHLALSRLKEGKSVLILVPEIAISRQIEERLRSVFGDSLKVFHSKQTTQARCAIYDYVRENACVVLGTRSSVFLPFRNPGLVIVDEEHDRSYKQDDPAPRYNGRDAAALLARMRCADLLLGSATPSLESLHNVQTGKYERVVLPVKFHQGAAPEIGIIDTNAAWRHHEMRGSFSVELINEMRKVLDRGDQVMIFRSRRAYSPLVQCSECGSIPKCPKCNVPLTYHRYNSSLTCHYCGYSTLFTTRCHQCSAPSLVDRGAGTEKIEEEIAELFPDYPVARFDADTTQSKKQEEKMIRDFASGRIRILVGTQMITKGFDFEKLSLVVLLSADSLLSVQDFRGDERTMQLIIQLLGRAGRRGNRGRLLVQTSQKEHPVFNVRPDAFSGALLEERRTFGYPPYVRLIVLTVKDKYEGRLWNVCRILGESLAAAGIPGVQGPVEPAMETVGGEHIRQFRISLPRNAHLSDSKNRIYTIVEAVSEQFKFAPDIIIDVDPM